MSSGLDKTAAVATAGQATESELPGPVLRCLAHVEPREVRWLWPGRVPLGRISLLVGRPGEGKSFLTTDMAARVSTGRTWPDGGACPSGSVILVSAEDDPHDTIRPRLDSHGADVRRVHLLATVRRRGEGGRLVEAMFTLEDLPALDAALRRQPDCRLIVIDPIGSFIGGGTDSHRDNEVRAVLAPVAQLAERYGPAVLIVAHRRKSTGTIADDLAIGSRAFTGIARAVWHLTRDNDDKRRRLLLSGKNNLAPEGTGLAFDIGGIPPAIQWEPSPVNMRADDALAAETDDGGDGGALAEATDFLRAELAHGRRAGTDVKAAAKAAGISTRTLDRARARLGVVTAPDGYRGPWTWALPHHTPSDSANPAKGGTLANSDGLGEIWPAAGGEAHSREGGCAC
jgi:putative DNA primase/helicase